MRRTSVLQRKLDEDIRRILQVGSSGNRRRQESEFARETKRRRHRLSLVAKALERSPAERLIERQKQAIEDGRRLLARQKEQKDWDRVEVCEEPEPVKEPESELAKEPEPKSSPPRFVHKKVIIEREESDSEPEPEPENLHNRCVHKKVIIERNESESEPEPEPEEPLHNRFVHKKVVIKRKKPVSVSRLSLSKEFHQRRLIEEQKLLSARDSEKRKRRKYQLDGSSSSDSFHEEQEEQQVEEKQEQPGAKCAKLGVEPGLGGDPMSIHHQQQHHHQHYHLPSTTTSNSVSSGTGYPPTSSLLLLTSAAVTGGGDSDSDGGPMAGHSHYTRSKASRIQGQMSLESATDMAIAASLSDLPRSKVTSLQGRVDTGTATELAIAQSLNENQQNLLNSSTNHAAPPETPVSIAAAANANNALATLCNIGNSCYLNSVLYTLRFAPNFIHNLHHLIEDTDSVYQRLSQNKLKSSSLGRNIPGLHNSSGRSWSSKDLASLGSSRDSSSSTTLNNPLTSNGTTSNHTPQSSTHIREDPNLPPKTNRQIVTEQLHELFQNLHRNEAIDTAEPYHAGNILRAVQDVSATFEGNQQQDAHEFLMCVLDSIRESCQALIKTITDHPDVLINTCPPVPESIETFVPETKSSGARVFFRRRKDPAKTASKQQQSPVNGGATTLPKAAGGGGDAADQLASLKSALLASSKSATLDDAIIRDRVQALGLDFFRDDFEGVTVAKTKCLECETCTEQKETMIDIAIPITASEVSDASKNPQLFYQNSCITREYFRGDNKYRCEVCCGYREAIRSISFEVLPRQLILQLKRFNGDMEKINSYIPTPFVLRCFCNTCLPKPDCDKPHIYRLYSVITHVGARMSVGHYIAYTSSLDVHGEYFGCGKDRRKQALLSGGSIDGGVGGGYGVGGGTGGGSATTTTGSQKSSEKSTSGQLKKLFGGKKASSAGDMSKKIKNNNKLNLINGMEGLNLINGAGSALGNSNTTAFGSQSGGNSPSSNGTPTSAAASLLASRAIPCAGLNCCGIHLKNSHLSLYGHHSHQHHHHHHNHNSSSSDSPAAGDNGSNGHVDGFMNGTAAAATPAAFEASLNQQLWHMCDDDKIKIMSQEEFQDLLSPNRRHVITPYLLFYARYDLVVKKSAAATSAEEPKVTAATGDVDMATAASAAAAAD